MVDRVADIVPLFCIDFATDLAGQLGTRGRFGDPGSGGGVEFVQDLEDLASTCRMIVQIYFPDNHPAHVTTSFLCLRQ